MVSLDSLRLTIRRLQWRLRRILQKNNGDLTDPELSDYAARIHAGAKNIFTADKVRI